MKFKFRVFDCETGEDFGIFEAFNDDFAISQLLAQQGVSPADASNGLRAEIVLSREEKERAQWEELQVWLNPEERKDADAENDFPYTYDYPGLE